MVLRFRHGRLLKGGENALYGLRLSEVSTHVLKRNKQEKKMEETIESSEKRRK